MINSDYRIGHDPEDSDTEFFVFENLQSGIVFKGTYTQCLIVVGGLHLGQDYEKTVALARAVGNVLR